MTTTNKGKTMSYIYGTTPFRDAEITAFQHKVLDNPNDSILTIIDNFDFQLIDAENYRDELIKIGHAARD